MATTLISKNPGDEITIKENGITTTFVVLVHSYPAKGRTLVWRKVAFGPRVWDASGVSTYAGSDIDAYLNDAYFYTLEPGVRNLIASVNIQSAAGNGSRTINTISRKVFLLSFMEFWGTGWGGTYAIAKEGTVISYLKNGSKNQVWDAKARAYDSSGAVVPQWMRSPFAANKTNAVYQQKNGNAAADAGGMNITVANKRVTDAYHIKPAFTLPSSVEIGDGGNVITNSAPSTPSSIYLPSTIKSGSYFTVSWSSSSDSDGNLQGYYVYRSLDGGSWSQIYQGGSTSTSDYISYGSANSVQYRVYAYDTQGASSSYCYSNTKTIVHNLAPSTPSSITVPTFVKGGTSLTVTWGAASDSDGNLSGYQLDRQYNGGSWSQIYSGSGRSYTDTITKGWTSVAYRVRAYDSYSSYSSYTTSPTRTVNNNTAPAITSDLSGDLGNKDAAFSFDYSVADVDGDAVTVTEAIDGVTKRTYTATLDSANTFTISADDFMCLLNGPHAIKITATDSNTGTSDLTLTFTKTVYACRITLAEPKAVGDAITKTVLMITRSIPADAEFTVMVTNNANDPEPVWEDVTANVKTSLNYIYENKTAENGPAYNFVITASRAEGGQGGYISSIGGAFE